MVKYLFELHKDSNMAIDEFKAVVSKVCEFEILEEEANYVYIDTSVELPDLTGVLALTHNIYEYICDYDDESLKNADWKKFYKNNFSIKSIDSEVIDKISTPLWDAVENPKVKLKDSDTVLRMRLNKVFVLRQKISTEMLLRASHKRPVSSPVSLCPRLARAMINLTTGKKLYDPFCGTGGIMLEAAMVDRDVMGSDMSYSMLKGTDVNLRHYNIKDFKIFRADATKHVLDEKADVIVCDPPYGRGSSLFGAEKNNLYLMFLKNVHNLLKKGGDLVIIFPDYAKYKEIIQDAGLKIKAEYEEYIHRTLTRVIIHIVL